jgi:hypothetical protein
MEVGGGTRKGDNRGEELTGAIKKKKNPHRWERNLHRGAGKLHSGENQLR